MLQAFWIIKDSSGKQHQISRDRVFKPGGALETYLKKTSTTGEKLDSLLSSFFIHSTKKFDSSYLEAINTAIKEGESQLQGVENSLALDEAIKEIENLGKQNALQLAGDNMNLFKKFDSSEKDKDESDRDTDSTPPKGGA